MKMQGNFPKKAKAVFNWLDSIFLSRYSKRINILSFRPEPRVNRGLCRNCDLLREPRGELALRSFSAGGVRNVRNEFLLPSRKTIDKNFFKEAFILPIRRLVDDHAALAHFAGILLQSMMIEAD